MLLESKTDKNVKFLQYWPPSR